MYWFSLIKYASVTRLFSILVSPLLQNILTMVFWVLPIALAIFYNGCLDPTLLEGDCIGECTHNPPCFESSGTAKEELTEEQAAAEIRDAQLADDIEKTARKAEMNLKIAIKENNNKNIECNREILRWCLDTYTGMGLEAEELPDPEANPE